MSFQDADIVELENLDTGAGEGGGKKEIDYERLEKFMSRQMAEAKVGLIRDMSMKLSDVRSKVASNVLSMQKETLATFGPKFAELEEKFHQMDATVHEVARITAELSEPKKKSRRRRKNNDDEDEDEDEDEDVGGGD